MGYCGHNDIIVTLRNDTFRTMIAGRQQAVSRWAMNVINETLRNEKNATKAEITAQYDKKHGAATIKSGDQMIIPADELAKGIGDFRPIVAVRIFHFLEF